MHYTEADAHLGPQCIVSELFGLGGGGGRPISAVPPMAQLYEDLWQKTLVGVQGGFLLKRNCHIIVLCIFCCILNRGVEETYFKASGAHTIWRLVGVCH